MADGRDANTLLAKLIKLSSQHAYQSYRGIVHNSRESDENKKARHRFSSLPLFPEEMRRFEEAERRTAEGYRGALLNPARSDTVKRAVAAKLERLPHWSAETKKEREQQAGIGVEGKEGGAE
ncbi:hypothetical protein JCM10207_002502 [Rhodosporidiobolus poonsookiae]